MREVDTVLFDLDGTLLPMDNDAFTNWTNALPLCPLSWRHFGDILSFFQLTSC